MTKRISHILNANKFKVDLEVIFIQCIIFYKAIVTDRGELTVPRYFIRGLGRSKAVQSLISRGQYPLSLEFSPPSLYPADSVPVSRCEIVKLIIGRSFQPPPPKKFSTY